MLTAACGGNEERLNQAFIQQGDAIRAKYNEKRAEVERRFPLTVDPTSPQATEEDVKQFGRSVPEQIEIGRAQLAELRDLPPPENLEDE
jgi:hypothetical protein